MIKDNLLVYEATMCFECRTAFGRWVNFSCITMSLIILILYIENNRLCFHDMKNLSRRLGWIRVNNKSARASCLRVFSQA